MARAGRSADDRDRGRHWRVTRTAAGISQPAVRLLAVLPLKDLSGTDAYVADRMTEALTQELSTAGPLRVVSRTSVGRLVAANMSIPELAKTLKADAVVEGSVIRSGGEVRVSVRVIQAGTNTAVWASPFERASPDLPRLQQEIASAIASELRLALHPRTVERWQNPQAVNVAACERLLRRSRSRFSTSAMRGGHSTTCTRGFHPIHARRCEA